MWRHGGQLAQQLSLFPIAGMFFFADFSLRVANENI
jgi:hypothetical protein